MICLNKKERQIRLLWKAAFKDGDSFIRFYFKHVYKDENALTLWHDGRIVSTMQLLPYTMNFYGAEIPIVYIAGACTAERERGKGWMERLMNLAFEEMGRRGAALATLIPAGSSLFSYYGKYGFTEAFEYSLGIHCRSRIVAPEGKYYAEIITGKADKRVYDYFDRRLRERPVGILHNYCDWDNIMLDLKLSHGGVFVVCHVASKEISGIAFAVPNSPRASKREIVVLVKDFFHDGEEAGSVLFNHIADYYSAGSVIYRMPCSSSRTSHSYGMARVMDAERMVDIWLGAHPESGLGREKLLSMDVGGLTSLLLDYPSRAAYMSLMLD